MHPRPEGELMEAHPKPPKDGLVGQSPKPKTRDASSQGVSEETSPDERKAPTDLGPRRDLGRSNETKA